MKASIAAGEPSRKRMKTDGEKERCRVERRKRNIVAAKISRERKRKYVEKLEEENAKLKARIDRMQQELDQLWQEIGNYSVGSNTEPTAGGSFDEDVQLLLRDWHPAKSWDQTFIEMRDLEFPYIRPSAHLQTPQS